MGNERRERVGGMRNKMIYVTYIDATFLPQKESFVAAKAFR